MNEDTLTADCVPPPACPPGHAAAFGRRLPPHLRQHELVSLLEMLIFWSGSWAEKVALLRELGSQLRRNEHVETARMRGVVQEIKWECDRSDFPALGRQLGRFVDKTRETNLSDDVLKDNAIELLASIEDELRQHLYLKVPAEVSGYYTAPPTPPSLPASLNGVAHEIEEASKCFALDRHTACVCHCMRALDIAVRASASALGITIPPPNWQQAIDQINAAIAQNNKQDREWRLLVGQQWAEAATEFPNFKEAWRNHAMHGTDTYPLDRARKILESVIRFFGVLSPLLP